MHFIPRTNTHAAAVAEFIASSYRLPIFNGRKVIGYRYVRLED